MPVKAMVPKPEPAAAEAAAVENMSGTKSAAMEHGATAAETDAVKRRTATMEAAATVKTASTVASPTAMTTTAADFGRQPVGGVCHCRRRARTDQR